MMTTRLARRIVTAAFLVAAPWGALAQTETESAGAQAWFLDYIQPSLGRHYDDMSIDRPPVLYDPNEARRFPDRVPPDRMVYRHQAEVGAMRAVVLAGDLPPTRADRIDVRDWNDVADRSNPMRAEMFRFYMEPVAPTPPICRAIIP